MAVVDTYDILPPLQQLAPVLDNKPTLLAIDLFAAYKTDDVIDTFLAHDIRVSWIPGGCTGLVQPLDVSINRPFKEILKEILEIQLDAMEQKEAVITTAGGKLNGSAIGRCRIMTTWAVGEAWERFSTEKQHVVIKSFRVVGLSLPIDGSCDSEISIKGLETATIAEGLKDWAWCGLDSDSIAPSAHETAVITELDDDNETVDFEAGYPRHLDQEDSN